jgi:cytochrome P450 family 4
VVVPHRIANPWLLFSWIYRLTETANEELDQKKRLDEFTRRMIKRRREAMQSGEKTERKSLLDYMLEISEANADFTEQDIVNEACTFMLAVSECFKVVGFSLEFMFFLQGQDSVGASLEFSIFLLGQNQRQQEKCFEEINEIFGDDDRPPTMNDLKEMKYLEMCIKEAIR